MPNGQEQQFQFAFFELALTKRRRSIWVWRVCTQSGRLIMHGSETTRAAARYHGQRALFLLLSTSARNYAPWIFWDRSQAAAVDAQIAMIEDSYASHFS